MTRRVFGELELAVLKIFKGEKNLTVKDVLIALGGEDKYTTIMTVMNRLVEKKVLHRERKGHHYEYWVNASYTASSPTFLEKVKQKIFGGNAVSMAAYLIESTDISDSELEEIEKLIKDVRQSRCQS